MRDFADDPEEDDGPTALNYDLEPSKRSASAPIHPLQELANRSPRAQYAAYLQALADRSPQAQHAAHWQAIANSSAQVRRAAQLQQAAQAFVFRQELAILQSVDLYIAQYRTAQIPHPKVP